MTALSQSIKNIDLPDLYDADIEYLQKCLSAKCFTSVQLVTAYWRRIEEVNINGPGLRAVIGDAGDAFKQAAALDKERDAGKIRGPLHGIPLLCKDSINVVAFHTTCGSHALEGSIVARDAHAVALLRQSGAIFMGKASLSQWSYIRDYRGGSRGWNSILGEAVNPYHAQASPLGSSNGSAIAITIGLAASSLGAETVGSISAPAAAQCCVGVRPTLGLISRSGLQQISGRLDVIGPIARCVKDAAILLQAMVGTDEADPFTYAQPKQIPDYSLRLRHDALLGVRLGVPRVGFFDNQEMSAAKAWSQYEEAFAMLGHLGAVLVDPANFDDMDILGANIADTHLQEDLIDIDMKVEFGRFLEGFAHIPSGIRSLQDIVNYNNQHAELEKPEYHESQVGLERATQAPSYGDKHVGPAYAQQAAAQHQVDSLMRRHRLDAMVMPFFITTNASRISALCGCPTVVVPAGYMPNDAPMILERADRAKRMHVAYPGAPIGLLFLGPRWSEAELLSYAYAFEQATQHRLRRRVRPEAIPKTQLFDVL